MTTPKELIDTVRSGDEDAIVACAVNHYGLACTRSLAQAIVAEREGRDIKPFPYDTLAQNADARLAAIAAIAAKHSNPECGKCQRNEEACIDEWKCLGFIATAESEDTAEAPLPLGRILPQPNRTEEHSRQLSDSRAASIERVLSAMNIEPLYSKSFHENAEGTEKTVFANGALIGTFTADPLDPEWKWEPEPQEPMSEVAMHNFMCHSLGDVSRFVQMLEQNEKPLVGVLRLCRGLIQTSGTFQVFYESDVELQMEIHT